MKTSFISPELAALWLLWVLAILSAEAACAIWAAPAAAAHERGRTRGWVKTS